MIEIKQVTGLTPSASATENARGTTTKGDEKRLTDVEEEDEEGDAGMQGGEDIQRKRRTYLSSLPVPEYTRGARIVQIEPTISESPLAHGRRYHQQGQRHRRVTRPRINWSFRARHVSTSSTLYFLPLPLPLREPPLTPYNPPDRAIKHPADYTDADLRRLDVRRRGAPKPGRERSSLPPSLPPTRIAFLTRQRFLPCCRG
jgi:hypothetical protein